MNFPLLIRKLSSIYTRSQITRLTNISASTQRRILKGNNVSQGTVDKLEKFLPINRLQDKDKIINRSSGIAFGEPINLTTKKLTIREFRSQRRRSYRKSGSPIDIFRFLQRFRNSSFIWFLRLIYLAGNLGIRSYTAGQFDFIPKTVDEIEDIMIEAIEELVEYAGENYKDAGQPQFLMLEVQVEELM